MKTTVTTILVDALRTDLLALPVFAGTETSREIERLDLDVDGLLLKEARAAGFSGEDGKSFVFQTHGALPSHHILLAGCGDPAAPLTWYKLAETIVRTARDINARSAAVAPGEATTAAAVGSLAEGARLADYRFTRLRSQAAEPPQLSMRISMPRRDATLRSALTTAETAAEATCYARDLINTPAGMLPPAALAREARLLAGGSLTVHVYEGRRIERLGMGALLGVASGSAAPPCFIEVIYRPEITTHACIALVGKGVTFDSGGLSLKTASSMQTQKRDMAGGAAVLAVLRALPALALPVEVRGYIPAAENMPGGKAIKPGDVVHARNGKTIEVLNTDAEGRLLLADALAYAAEKSPDRIIDLATLTGAVNTALGSRCAAIMGTDEELVNACIAAGAAAGERLWELPLVPEYRRDLDSDIADIKNTGSGQAGTIVAGLFLREFTAGLPWAHIDFSSTAVSSGHACHPRGASGFAVRTILRYLSALAA